MFCVAFLLHVFPSLGNRLVGLVVKASASRAEDHGFKSRLCRDFSGVELYQAHGVTGPGVNCDWVRWKVGSATSISVWQHVQLSRSVSEIHSHVAGTLNNQPTNCSAPTSLHIDLTEIEWLTKGVKNKRGNWSK